MNPASAQKRIAFGYNRYNDKIVLHEGQAGCVKLIFAYYDEGKSIAEIKGILEGLGCPSPQNKKVWGKQTVSNILSNPHYLGSEDYPKIIEQDLFDRIQARKAQAQTQKTNL